VTSTDAFCRLARPGPIPERQNGPRRTSVSRCGVYYRIRAKRSICPAIAPG